MMKSRQLLIIVGLLLLVLAAIAGLVLTRESAQPTLSKASKKSIKPSPVDEKPLQTARSLAPSAATPGERRFAEEAERVSDHEVDLAFAQALRDAGDQVDQASPQNRALFDRLSKAEVGVAKDQARLNELKKQVEAATGDRKDNLQQQLELLQVQVELDGDEVSDVKEEIDRSGADPRTSIQNQFTTHEAAEHALDQTRSTASASAPVNYRSDTLWGQLTEWIALHNQAASLNQARDDANQNVTRLTQSHEKLKQLLKTQGSDDQAITQQALSQLTSGEGDAGDYAEATDTAVTSLNRLSDVKKDLTDFDKRVQDHQEIRDIYGNWLVLVALQQRAVLHRVIQSVLWIILIFFAVYLTGLAIDHFLPAASTEHNRIRTLRVVIRFVVQVIGVLLALFIVFGAPQQMPTILGLAGAGLTVALKDFIVAFVGWFVLIGRNGIKVGDWVEINGVVGEVIEVSLFRTVLLETGNWTDTGHPTGRKVSFVNSYAIEGHYFNFSTTGQWLWDELEIMVPSSEDPYPIIESIQKMVEKETEANARAAEKEWKEATTRYRVQSVTATPAVNLRPTTSGVEVHIRYITRAHERYETRARLYQALVALLRRKGVSQPEEVATAK